MAHYYLGDSPAETLVIPTTEPDELAAVDAATGTLHAPSGDTVALSVDVDQAEGLVLVDFATELTEAGLYLLLVELSSPEQVLSFAPVSIPVEDPSSPWYTIATARNDWPGAPSDDARLYRLLDVSRTQCLEFAPARNDVPTHYREAQLLQARNIWNASKTDPSSSTYGPDGFAATVYPLDWTVQQMLRPRRARPVIG